MQKETHKINDGGPAYPANVYEYVHQLADGTRIRSLHPIEVVELKEGEALYSGPDYYFGMSLRDWFAGQALTGMFLIASNPIEATVKAAYKIADAMLAERSK